MATQMITEEPLTAQPGPWAASEMTMDAESWASLNSGNLHIVRANWDGFTGDVVACVWCDDEHDEAATASLIAAAPTLYAALSNLLAKVEFVIPDADQAEGMAALAAARGEEP